MKIKKKAIRRVRSTASFESGCNCASSEHQESYSVPIQGETVLPNVDRVGGETVLPNVDGVGLPLDLVAGHSCVARNVTTHVFAGIEVQKHTGWNGSVHLTGMKRLSYLSPCAC